MMITLVLTVLLALLWGAFTASLVPCYLTTRQSFLLMLFGCTLIGVVGRELCRS